MIKYHYNKDLIKKHIFSNRIISHAFDLVEDQHMHDNFKMNSQSVPPVLMAGFEEPATQNKAEKTYTTAFEKLSLALRYQRFKKYYPTVPKWVEKKENLTPVCGHNLVQAVKECTYELNDEQLFRSKVKSKSKNGNILHTPNLKLVGLKIDGDLNLSKIDIPFSIRLIGCWITGSIIIDRTKLQTLDLSGCVIDKGISGMFLHTRGSLRMRRTVCLGPSDFGGAIVDGELDISDCIMLPANRLSSDTGYVGDRGMLNLNQAVIAKDIRANRSRIYGGVNMRGARVSGCVFFTDSVLRSPEAALWREVKAIRLKSDEKSLHKYVSPTVLPRNRIFSENTLEDVAVRAGYNADAVLARRIWPSQIDQHEPSDTVRSLEVALELLSNVSLAEIQGLTSNGNKSYQQDLLKRLLVETHRGYDCAMRCEGIKVEGSFNSRAARFQGRVRLKYSTFGGGVDFAGTRFTSPRILRGAIIQMFDLKSYQKKVDVIAGRGLAIRGPFTSLVTETIEYIYQVKLTEHECENEGVFSSLIEDYIEFEYDVSLNPNYNKLIQIISEYQAFEEDISRVKTFHDEVFADQGRRPSSSGREYALDMRECSLGGSLNFGRDDRFWVPQIGKAGITPKTDIEKQLIRNIARKLLEADEDPLKILPLFSPLSGDPFEKIKQLRSRRKSKKSDAEKPSTQRQNKNLKSLYDELEKNSGDIDKEFYAWENATIYGKLELPYDRAPGIYKNKLGSKEFQKIITNVEKSCARHGCMKSCILVGEIGMAGIKVGGSLIMNTVIANVFNRSTDRQTLSLTNADIYGDADFRSSFGLDNIDARQIKIGGSVRFSQAPIFLAKDNKWSPIRARAVFNTKTANANAKINANAKTKKHNFERAIIRGEATFVFNREYGPSVILAEANVKGRIFIVPSSGGVELNRPEIKARINETKQKLRYADFWSWHMLSAFLLPFAVIIDQVIKRFTKVENDWTKEQDRQRFLQKKILDNIYSKLNKLNALLPILNFQHTSCSEIIHPPSSWPKQDGLLIEGFNYQMARDVGPLSPLRKTWRQTLKEYWQNIPRLILTVFLTMCSVTALYNLWVLVALIPEIPASFVQVYELSGDVNKKLFSLVVTFLLVKFFLKRFTRPRHSDGRPLGLEWLSLQRRRNNVRRLNREVVPWGPYLKASSILRQTGREKSANRIELERLRLRRKAMSFRTKGLLRFLLWVTDWISHYGFAPMRAANWVVFITLFGSMYFHAAYSDNLVVPADKSLWETASSFETKPLDFALKNFNPNKIPDAYPTFNSLSYAVDIIIPFVDLGQEERWTIKRPGPDSSSIPKTGNFFKHGHGFINLLRILGWAFCGLIAIAVTERLESIQARSEVN